MDTFYLSRLTKLDVGRVSELQGDEHLQSWKSNPFFELIVVTEGPVRLQVGDERMTLANGEICLLQPWEKHKSWQPDERFAGDVGSAALEAELRHAYAYLCQVFKRYAGMTIGAYVLRLRIQQAKHLLRHTALPVADVAAACGFDDPFYFSRSFKRAEGIGPSGFRAQAE